MNIKELGTTYGILVDKSLKVTEMKKGINPVVASMPTIKLEVVDNSKLESVLYEGKK